MSQTDKIDYTYICIQMHSMTEKKTVKLEFFKCVIKTSLIKRLRKEIYVE